MQRRLASRTTRWGLRTLVVGGLAGAAWLLAGTAAHAADRDVPLSGASLLGSVSSALDDSVDHTARPVVVRVLHAAARPLDSAPIITRHHDAASVLDVPARLLARPAATLTSTVAAATQPVRGTGLLRPVDRVVRDTTGALRLTGGPAASSILPGVVSPVNKAYDQAKLDPVRPVSIDDRPVTSRASTVGESGSSVLHAAPPVSRGTVAGVRRTGVPAPHVAVRGVRAAARDIPIGDDGPLPGPLHGGAATGIPAMGSNAPPGGGSPAVLPATVAASMMGSHPLALATDVEVRRHDAETPTASPD